MNPVSFLINSFFEERERWFLWLPVAMLSGISLYFFLPAEPSILILLVSPLLAAIVYTSRAFPQVMYPAALLLAFCLGFNAAQIETALVQAPALKAPLETIAFSGLPVRAEPMADGTRLTLTDLWIKDMPRDERPSRIRIKVKTSIQDLPAVGERLNMWGPLWPPNDPAMPGGYDFRRHAFFKQIGATGLSYVEPRRVESKYPVSFFWDGFGLLFEKMRRALTIDTIGLLQEPQKNMTIALLTGSQAGIDEDVMEAMRISGLSHLLSISGVHVSMMALLVYLPLRFFLALFPWFALRFPIKKIAAVSAITMTTLYTLLVGADAPTVRSALMTGIVFFAIVVDRRAMSLRLVALAATALMLASPSAVMGPSFQMSFAAVLAMIVVYEKRFDAALSEGVSLNLPAWLGKIPRALRDIAFTSIIATAATTPFTLYHFQTFSFYGVIANMVAIPLTSFWIMPCLLLTYCFAPFDLQGNFIEATGMGVHVLISIAQAVAHWPYAQFGLPEMKPLFFALFVSGGLWLCLWKTRLRFAGLILIGFGCLYPVYASIPDVLIADDDPVFAVKLANNDLAVFGKRKENFMIAQWKQRLGNPQTYYYSSRSLPDSGEEFLCDEEMCLFEKGGHTISFLLPQKKGDGEDPEKFCPKTEIIVAFEPRPDCIESVVIDGLSLKEKGAHAITFTKRADAGLSPFSIEPVRAGHERRPWLAAQ